MGLRKTLYFLACLLTVASTVSYAQSADQRYKDSLFKVLNTATADSTKCRIILDIIEVLPNGEWEVYNDKLLEIAKRNLQPGKQNTFLKFEAIAIRYKGDIDFNARRINEAIKNYKEGARLFAAINDKKGIAECLKLEGFLNENIGNTGKAIECYKNSLKFFEDTGDKSNMSEVLNNLCLLYKNSGMVNILKVLQYQLMCLKISEELHDSVKIVSNLNNIGVTYFEIGNIPKSLEYLMTVLKIKQKLKDGNQASFTLNNIGMVYMSQNDTATALKYYRESLKECKESDDKDAYASTTMSIGKLYQDKGDIEKALACYNEVLTLATASGNKLRIAQAYNFIGKVYAQESENDKAIENHNKSLLLYKEINDKNRTARVLLDIAHVYSKLHKTKEALTYALQGMEIGKTLGYPQILMSAAEELYALYQNEEDHKKALDMYRLFVQMRDSINNENTRKESIKNQLDFEYQRKESIMKEEQLRTEALYRQKRKYFIVVSGVLLLFVIAVSVTFYLRTRFRKEKEKNELALQLKDAEIKALQSQMNPHFIFNSISSAMVFIQSGQKEQALDYMTRFTRLIRFVLNGSESKTVSLADEIKFISLYVSLEQLRFNNVFDFKLDTDPVIDAETIEIPFMIIQPFVENAISHGLLNRVNSEKENKRDFKGLLNMHFTMHNEKLICEITDNGIGRKAAADIKQRSFGNNGSLGIKITNQRIGLLSNKECSVYYEDLYANGESNGTKVKIEIPILNQY